VPIRAVVLDLGDVLEVIDDSVFPGPWEERLGLPTGGFAAAAPISGLSGDPALGEVSESDVRTYWQRCLHLDDATTDAMMADFWRWYVGTLDQPLYDWFVGLRPRYRLGILSNSGPGAREHEVVWGLEDVCDAIVYSHEVGLAKPDPAIYALTAERLGVRPHEIAFLDDIEVNVQAAREAGWRAVRHRDTAQSIAAMQQILSSGASA